MKNKIIFIIFLLNSFIPFVKSQIVYFDFIPDTSITVVRYWYDNPYNHCLYSIPVDTSASMLISSDTIFNYTLSMGNQYRFISVSAPCANFGNYSSYFSQTSLNDSCYVIKEENQFPFISFLNYYDTINNNYNWTTGGFLMALSSGLPFVTDFQGEKYLGLKSIYKNKSYYGWLRLFKNDYTITLLDYAWNSTPNHYILVGDTGLNNMISHLKDDKFKIYPNPVSENLNIIFSKRFSKTKIDIFDILGREKYSLNISLIKENSSYSIDVSGWAKGIYFVKVNSGESVKTEKIFVE